MPDEQRKDDEHDVEAHDRHAVNIEPADEDEGEDENEVEAHVRKANVRMD